MRSDYLCIGKGINIVYTLRKVTLLIIEDQYIMKVQAKIQKWGNGLAIRISGVMRDIPHFKEGTYLDVLVFEDRLEIRKSQPKKRLKLPFSESELLDGMTPRKAHADIIAHPLKGEY